jgi:hypothetical protein
MFACLCRCLFRDALCLLGLDHHCDKDSLRRILIDIIKSSGLLSEAPYLKGSAELKDVAHLNTMFRCDS